MDGILNGESGRGGLSGGGSSGPVGEKSGGLRFIGDPKSEVTFEVDKGEAGGSPFS